MTLRETNALRGGAACAECVQHRALAHSHTDTHDRAAVAGYTAYTAANVDGTTNTDRVADLHRLPNGNGAPNTQRRGAV